MTTVTARPAAQQTERVLFGKLWLAGLLAIAGSVAANLAVTAIFQAVLRPDPGFLPLTFGPVIFFTVIGTLGAVITYAVVGRFSRRPLTLFRQIALGALVVSAIPDLALPFAPAEAFPGATWPSALALIVLHIIAWAICVQALTRLAGEE